MRKNLSKMMIIVVVVLVPLLAGIITGCDSKAADSETVQTYMETLGNTYYVYKMTEFGDHFHYDIFFNKDGTYHYITNDHGVNPTDGTNTYIIDRDEKGYYIAGLVSGMFEHLYLPDDPTVVPSELVDSEGRVFEGVGN